MTEEQNITNDQSIKLMPDDLKGLPLYEQAAKYLCELLNLNPNDMLQTVANGTSELRYKIIAPQIELFDKQIEALSKAKNNHRG